MSMMLLVLSTLALLGAAVGAWSLRRHTPRPLPERPSPVPSGKGEDVLPGAGGDADAANELAAFYAYQMAASRIKGTSRG